MMKARWIRTLCVGVLMAGLAAGCEEPAETEVVDQAPEEEVEAAEEASAEEEAEEVVEAEAAEAPPSAEELPIPEDFEEEVAASIAADSYAAALDALEAELDADGDDSE